MKKINIKSYLPLILIALLVSIGISAAAIFLNSIVNRNSLQDQSVELKSVSSKIVATGSVRSSNESTLHFQAGGKLTYLPFKEGDTVSAGQTIASLDTYALQEELKQALNTYSSTRDSFDQTQANSQNNILQNQQKSTTSTAIGSDQSTIINDIVKRLVDESQKGLDNSVINVELANYAVSLASIQTPIDGILIHEDVTTPFINITPATAFTVIDPKAYVFRANVSEDDIPFIVEGSNAKVLLTGTNKEVDAIVTKIYPEKITLSSGDNIYQVDLESSDINMHTAKYNQDGVVTISNKFSNPVVMVPSWTIVGNQSVWIYRNGNLIFQKVQTGDTINNMTEVLNGLSPTDRILSNPKYLENKKYLLF